MKITDDDSAKRRKLAARRMNERLKLLATSANAISLTMFGSTIILPSVNGSSVHAPWAWFLMAFGLHLLAQGILRWLRLED